MGKRDEALKLLRDGLDPVQIADRQEVTLGTILGYLDQKIGAGLLRRSDVLFSLDVDQRRKSRTKQYREIVSRYGSAAHALGDMYEDLRCIEVALHTHIRAALQARFGKKEEEWWRKGLSDTLRKKLVCRREEDEEPGDSYTYTDLLDLAEILEKNWSGIAAEVVINPSEKHNLLADLHKLNLIRRKVMHPLRSTAPSEEEFAFLRGVKQRFRE